MSPSRYAGPHCPNPAQEPEHTPARSNLYRPPPDTPRCNDTAANEESWIKLAQNVERELASVTKDKDKWRSLATDAVAAAKACLLALPVSDTARWQAIKDVEARLADLSK